MSKELINTHSQQVEKQRGLLDRLEEDLIQHQFSEEMAEQLIEVGYWANEVLQTRISYYERKLLTDMIQRVRYLQMLYLESHIMNRLNQLSGKLREAISAEAWQLYLEIDSLRGIEQEFFQDKNLHTDYNKELIHMEQELFTRLKSI